MVSAYYIFLLDNNSEESRDLFSCELGFACGRKDGHKKNMTALKRLREETRRSKRVRISLVLNAEHSNAYNRSVATDPGLSRFRSTGQRKQRLADKLRRKQVVLLSGAMFVLSELATGNEYRRQHKIRKKSHDHHDSYLFGQVSVQE